MHNNIVDALLGVSPSPIRLRSVRAGDHKTTCPVCSSTRRKKTDPCLSVTITEEGGDTKALWKCHHCGWSGWTGTGRFSRIRGSERRPFRRPTIEVAPPQPAVLDWLASRGIPEAIVRQERVFAAEVWMPQADNPRPIPVVAFPFFKGGALVNVKYREPINKWFRQEKDAEPCPYGFDSIVGAREIIICEGEIDRLSLLAVGFTAVISVPDGAPTKDLPADSPKFDWIEPCVPHFEVADRIILAVDADAPGQALRRELIRRVGQHKAWFVEWPCLEGQQINDANQMLMVAGEEDLRRCVDGALPVPVDGELSVHDLWGEIEAMHRGRTIEWWSTGFRSLDDIYRVVRGQVTVGTGAPNSGKALAVDTPVPTPSGWTTMGDLRPGSIVLGADGRLCRVTQASDVQFGRPCYRLTFSDGASIIADADHQWLASTRLERRSLRRQSRRPALTRPRGTDQRWKCLGARVRTTAEMASCPFSSDGAPNWAVPLPPVVEGADADLPIPPYTLGAWLGDGHSAAGRITAFDREVVDGICAEGFRVTGDASRGLYTIRGLIFRLRAEGLLNNKHIPAAYLRASITDRTALLRGIIDTDGHVGPWGQVEITTTSALLMEGILELARSLGFVVPTPPTRRAMLNGRDCGPKWRILFRGRPGICTVARKAARLPPASGKKHWRVVRSIKPVPSVPVRCIEVDSPDHLFLAGREMIVTHNSTFLDNVIVNLALNDGWKFCIFSPENDPARHAVNLLEKAARQPFFDGPSPRLTLEEVRSYKAFLAEHFHFLKFERQGNDKRRRADVDWLIAMIEYQVRRYGIDGVVLDPYNRIAKPPGSAISETDHVLDLLDSLQACARRNHIHIWLVAHPAKQQRDRFGKRPEDLTLQDAAGCHDEETEVLTADGWKPHAQVTSDDLVCCFDPEAGVLRYQRPSKVHVYDHDGPMHHYLGYGQDLLVTPRHRMVVRPAWPAPRNAESSNCGIPHGRWSFLRSEQITAGIYKMPIAAPLAGLAPAAGEPIPHADEVEAWRFVGWYVSEGWETSGAVAICQRAEASCAPRSCVLALGLPFTEQVAPGNRAGEKDMWRARLLARGPGRALCKWLIRQCGIGAASKRLPAACFSAPEGARKALLEALIAGDGTTIWGARVRGALPAFKYHTVSPGLADDVQRLAITLGHCAHVRRAPPGEPGHRERFTVVINRADRRERGVTAYRGRQTVHYAGKVYCLTVPTGAYVTRRNGCMAITGNSANFDNATDMGFSITRIWKNPATGEDYKPRETPIRFTCLKARDRYSGQKGASAMFRFDFATGRYVEWSPEDHAGAARDWRDD